jgi:hypothetical protein
MLRVASYENILKVNTTPHEDERAQRCEAQQQHLISNLMEKQFVSKLQFQIIVHYNTMSVSELFPGVWHWIDAPFRMIVYRKLLVLCHIFQFAFSILHPLSYGIRYAFALQNILPCLENGP